jgi:hypothetical protein
MDPRVPFSILMLDLITEFDYQYVITDGGALRAAEIVNTLTKSGVNLLGFSEFPAGPEKSQVDLITDCGAFLEETAEKLGWKLSGIKSGFLIQGEDTPNAIGEVLERLEEAKIHVTAVQAISAGAGRFGALLWVKPREAGKAATALRALTFDPVEESSEESFPASDAPAWTVGRAG